MLLSSWDTLLDQPLVSDSHSDASGSTEIRLATDERNTSEYRTTVMITHQPILTLYWTYEVIRILTRS